MVLVPGDLEQRVAPVTTADQRLLTVPGPVASLFPGGGLQRGWSIGVSGHGGWSLALSILGSALGADGWVACVGLEELGLVAADELGVRLERLLMVESPGPARLAPVVASLIEVVDVVCLGPTDPIRARDARRLAARAREQSAVLLHLDGGRSWPQALDVTLTVEPGPWSGIGAGHGHLRSRPVTVTATGRRSMAKPRRVEVLLPGPDGALAPVPSPVTDRRGEPAPIDAEPRRAVGGALGGTTTPALVGREPG
jgi:hypothetical protein